MRALLWIATLLIAFGPPAAQLAFGARPSVLQYLPGDEEGDHTTPAGTGLGGTELGGTGSGGIESGGVASFDDTYAWDADEHEPLEDGLGVGTAVEEVDARRRELADLRSLMTGWRDALEEYRTAHGRYPESLAAISQPAAVAPPGLPRPVVPRGNVDPWGNPLTYERPTELQALLKSAGPDQVFGTNDDTVEHLPRIVLDDR